MNFSKEEVERQIVGLARKYDWSLSDDMVLSVTDGVQDASGKEEDTEDLPELVGLLNAKVDKHRFVEK